MMMERGECHPDGGKFTLVQLLVRYAAEVSPMKKSARSERYLLAAWKKWDCAVQLADRISITDVARWRDQRLQKGASTGTVRNALATLSAVYQHAASDWGLATLENPVRRLKRPPPGKGRTRRVSEEELRAIKTHTGSLYLPALMDLAVATGMRLSELVSLRWEYINMRNCTVHLTDSKNGEPRIVPLSTVATTTLERLREGPASQISGRLFPLMPNAVTVAFKRAVNRARSSYVKHVLANGGTDGGLFVNLRFHDLRHEAVSRLFERGLNTLEVGSISGHKSLQMIARYTHLKAADLVWKLG